MCWLLDCFCACFEKSKQCFDVGKEHGKMMMLVLFRVLCTGRALSVWRTTTKWRMWIPREKKGNKKSTRNRRRRGGENERERENQKGESQATERTANEQTYDSLTMFTYDILMSVCLLACFFSCGRSQFLTFIIIFVSLSLRLAALFRSRTVNGPSVWRAVCVMWVHQCVCERERETVTHCGCKSDMFDNNTCVLCAA